MYICFDNEHPKSKRLLMFKKLNVLTVTTWFVQTKCHLNCLRATVGGERSSQKRVWGRRTRVKMNRHKRKKQRKEKDTQYRVL
jgi:hypothetical protein